MADGHDDVPDTEFSPSERHELRRILQSQQRVQWLWSTARVWATWVAIVVGGLYAALAILRDSLKALTGVTH